MDSNKKLDIIVDDTIDSTYLTAENDLKDIIIASSTRGGIGLPVDELRPFCSAFGMLQGQIAISQQYKKIIRDNNIQLPRDMNLKDILLSSEIEPEFLDDLRERYPEYFI